jgi:8-oxo-dGTP diphosphatase
MSSDLQTQLAQQPSEGTAAIAVIIRDGRILLGLREYEDAPTVWTAPGGSVDGSETLEQAVRRETKEETGIDDLEFIDYIGEVNAENRDPLHVFHCESNQKPELAEPEKFTEWRWFALDEFVSGQPENYISEPSRELIVDYLKTNGII